MDLAMPYRIIHNERVAQGLRRIATEELEAAIAQLREEDESRRDEGIHQARKSIKKLRGIVKLLSPCLGEDGGKDDAALRDTGRALSKLRDAAALIETVEALSERYFSDPAMEQLAVVRSALRRRLEDTVRGEDCRTVSGGAVASLKLLKRRVHRWQAPDSEFLTIAQGFERTYRHGRKALKRAVAEPDVDNLHSLRKRVKEHWYHVRLLDGALRVSPEPREKALGELQELLGDHHNLAVLRDVLSRDPAAFGAKKTVPAVLDLIGRAQKELQRTAFAAAGILYAAKPGEHIRQVAAAWQAWRGEAEAAKPAGRAVAKHRTSAA